LGGGGKGGPGGGGGGGGGGGEGGGEGQEKRGRVVYGRWEERGQEVGLQRWREAGEKGKNYVTLCNILQLKKCIGVGANKYRTGTGIKGYSKQEVLDPPVPPLPTGTLCNIFVGDFRNGKGTRLQNLMQAGERVWKNSKVCVNLNCKPKFAEVFWNFSKLPQVMAMYHVSMKWPFFISLLSRMKHFTTYDQGCNDTLTHQ